MRLTRTARPRPIASAWELASHQRSTQGLERLSSHSERATWTNFKHSFTSGQGFIKRMCHR